MKILIVDDSKMARMSLTKKLPEDVLSSSELTEAENGLLGVEAYKTLKPDIVFMDLTMPIMDGYEAIQKIIEIDPNAYIVVVSADSQPIAVQRALSYGAKKHIEKNISGIALADVFIDFKANK